VRGDRRGSLPEGLRSLAQGRLVLLLTATTIALALPAAFALRPSLQEVFAGTLAGDHVLRNHAEFAPLDVVEFLHQKRAALAGARQAAMAAALLAVFLQIFFAGGFVETLARGRKVPLGEFLVAAARHFGHNLKCFGIFLAALILALAGWLGASAALGRALFESTPPGSPWSLLFHIGTGIVALLIFAVLSLLHDFARLARRREPRIGAWRGWRAAWRVLTGSIFPALGLFLFWLLAGGLLWIGILSLEWATRAVSIAAILLHTGLQVAAVVVRSAVRVGAWGSYAAFVDARTAPPAPIPEPDRGETRLEVLVAEPMPPLDSFGTTPA
jgi:MFS family permease